MCIYISTYIYIWQKIFLGSMKPRCGFMPVSCRFHAPVSYPWFHAPGRGPWFHTRFHGRFHTRFHTLVSYPPPTHPPPHPPTPSHSSRTGKIFPFRATPHSAIVVGSSARITYVANEAWLTPGLHMLPRWVASKPRLSMAHATTHSRAENVL